VERAVWYFDLEEGHSSGGGVTQRKLLHLTGRILALRVLRDYL